MEWIRRIVHGAGPVVLGGCLLALPILFAPKPAQASTGNCAGYDTVECSTLEWCIGPKEFGIGLCVTNVSYYPPVTVILTEAMEDLINIEEGMGDYIHDIGDGGGGGGAF